MADNNIPDTYSNDDKQKNEVFALPLAGKRRKASEAGFSRAHHQQQKRPHLQGSHKKEVRDSEFTNPLEMKRTKSNAYLAIDKPFAALFEEKPYFQGVH
jgi:hypothetical protein